MPEVRIRNTFIEVVSGTPRCEQLRRTRSDQFCSHTEVRQDFLDSEDCTDEDMPPVPELCWARTVDGYDPADPWSLSQDVVGPAESAYDSWVGAEEGAITASTMETQLSCTVDQWCADQWGVVMPAAVGCMLLPIYMMPESYQALDESFPFGSQGLAWGAALPESVSAFLPAAAPSPPILKRAFSVTSQLYRVSWLVHGRTLHSDDSEVASPSFRLSFSRDLQFQLVLQAERPLEADAKVSFKTSGGKGRVLLRCLDEVDCTTNPTMTFRIAVCPAVGGIGPRRGPVRHNFVDCDSCGLLEDEELWDFNESVDKESRTFTVSLEVLAGNGKSAEHS